MSRRKITILAALPLLIAVFLFGGKSAVQLKYRRARETWKTAALRQLAGMSLTNQQILTELNQIRNPTPNLDFRWANEHVILMTNGQYLIYAWWHGANSGFVDHLFLAHGTDDRWYYSTYHFCNEMAGILGDDPPGSIQEFVKRYSVHEFDGTSDECLRHTWPPR